MSDMPQPILNLERVLERMGKQVEASARRWTTMDDFESWGDDFGAMRIDLIRDEDAYQVTADVPGFDRDDIHLTLEGRTLHIEASMDESSEGADRDLLRRERHHRSVSRMIRVPESIEAEEASARLQNGVLTVRLPRHAAGDGYEIDIE